MKNLMKHILLEKDFIIDEISLEDESSLLAERTNQNKFDFLTVMFLKLETSKRELINEKIDKYLLKIIETRQTFVGLEKNLSLLILLEVENLALSKEISSLIHDIEEDPYDFKKYMMVYTKEQVSLLESLLKDSGLKITSLINQILNDTSQFSKFKNNEDSNEALIYDLVSKLFIKLPFLNIENQQQILPSLLEEIVECMGEQEKNLWNSLMKLNENSEAEPSIEEILNCIGVGQIE
ncbi:ABC-three component system middle component 1 [Bacillus sp. AFS029533]|uniref:ABC-three component system middle component 1 n=1 Tax=Bacillus sp. AFS029533 TaxID=2033494 RepID=UPI000BFE608B|nr:ABC-three component system middle component 1 [Bacillus sp. AFS029533]PGZ90949.1 hypothetical protein COE53_16570 [Bacillus sp. AFS029533]